MEMIVKMSPAFIDVLRDEIKKEIQANLEVKGSDSNGSDLLTVDECAEFLSLRKQTVYGLIHQRKIPFFKKTKRVYFSKSELIKYLHSGRKKTIQEIEAEI